MNDNLNKREKSAIQNLRKLSREWPESLWLFSASGTLCVVKKDGDGQVAFTNHGSIDQGFVVASIDIENDGGDW